MRWQAQEQAAAALTLQAQMMGGGKRTAQPKQDAPRKTSLMSMEQFIAAQESK